MSYFTTYKIDSSTLQEFRNTIIQTGAIVSGSFALANYLKQEGLEVLFDPSDMDIFISDSCEKKYIQLLDFLRSFGFENTNKHTDYTDYVYGTYCKSLYEKRVLESIDRVVTFSNSDNKMIQIIVVKCDNMDEYIKTNFDLSVCITWWDAVSNTFETMMPEMTKKYEMCIMRYNIPFSKLSKRVEKYKSRGFKLMNKPQM
jgi:hypothetical protein